MTGPDASAHDRKHRSAPAAEGRWPTFLVIGAGRCGTTTLHGLLLQHPRVLIPPIKEPNYFAMRALDIDFEALSVSARIAWADSISDPDAYRALFAPPPQPQPPFPQAPQPGNEPIAADGPLPPETVPPPDSPPEPPLDPVAFGECSPVYLAVAGVARLIRDAVPDVRLIAILRDPVDRAISHHAHNVACGIDPEPDFEKALIADQALGEHANYLFHGRYADRLEPFARQFDREQILLLDYGAFAADPLAIMNRIFTHIGVEPLAAMTTDLRALPSTPAPIPDDVRRRLAALFADDTRNLVERYGFEPARAWSSYPTEPASA